MVKLKEFLEIQEAWDPKDHAAKKRDVKRLEMKCNKAVKMLDEIVDDFKKMHNVKVSDSVLWNTHKDFRDVARNADAKFGGWFGFIYADEDYIK